MPESRQQMMPSTSGRSDKLHNHVCIDCAMPPFTNVLMRCTLHGLLTVAA